MQIASGAEKIGPIVDHYGRHRGFQGRPVWHLDRYSFQDRLRGQHRAWARSQSSKNTEVTIVLSPQILRSSVSVEEKAPPVAQTANVQTEVHPSEVRTLPTNPATVGETLPLVPGIVRSPEGGLIIDGSGEQRSSLVVNQSDQTDPATGAFGQTVPVDAIDTVNVLNTPFLAQYGRFTQTVVAIDTKRGGEKWHADLNDPFPDFRVRSYHVVGIRNETPRFTVGDH